MTFVYMCAHVSGKVFYARYSSGIGWGWVEVRARAAVFDSVDSAPARVCAKELKPKSVDGYVRGFVNAKAKD